MSTESQGTGTPTSRGRLSWMGRSVFLDLYGWLDESRAFRPTLLGTVAVAVGLLLTPDLIVRNYPTDISLVGTPAPENIKAPYDLDVVDEETTAKVRDEAVSQVRRVFDFDALLGDKASQRIGRAFTWMRQQLDAANPEGRPARAREDEVVASGRTELERQLGVTLRNEELAALKAVRFGADAEVALKRLVLLGQSEPIVVNRATLDVERERGFTMQRVPSDGHPSRIITDTDSITDLETARARLAARAAHLLPEAFPEMSAGLRNQVTSIAVRLLEPNLSLNRAETELQRADARVAVKPVNIAIKKGEMIIRDGERLTRRHLMILEALRQNSHNSTMLLVGCGGTVLLLVLAVIAGRFASGYGRHSFELKARDLLFLAVMFVLGLGTARIWLAVARVLHDSLPRLPLEAFLFSLPAAAGAMVVRLVLRAEVALLFALTSSLMLGLLADGDRMLSIYALAGAVAGTTTIRTISARSDLLRAGAWVGVTQVGTAIGIQLFAATDQISGYLWPLPAAFASGIVAAVLALSLTPVIEWAFNYTTDLKLLELANLNHPALKELIVQAPGSYHHSIIVGALVEAAAESVGANPLLARVMAYYHDLGKGCNPGYFIENQRTGHNPHDKLKPSMSAMIIRRHVTDGIDLAKRHGLGEQILAGIAQHHGNTLIHFFYHKAKEQADDDQIVNEADYRYPGQKPQTREAALVMLGDSIEAASRSLADPTSARLQGLVNRIISHKFTDGQLEECDLTLRDLHTIAKSFSRVLNSIYHHRLEYPDILKDITGNAGKKQHGDTDTKPSKRAEGPDGSTEDDPPDNLRRLGL
jgi:putative nucleotidyltransferase with HDIG domain